MEINTLLPKFRRRVAIFCPLNIKSNNFVYLNGQVILVHLNKQNCCSFPDYLVIWERAVSDSGSSGFRHLDLGSTVLFQIYKQRKQLKTENKKCRKIQ